MKSAVHDILPPRIRRSLVKLGADITIARKKRNFTIAMMVERIGVAKGTYLRAEKGDPTVSIGVYAMAFFVLGFGEVFTTVADATQDQQGFMLDVTRLPKRVRVSKQSKPA